jgi:signal transduction histidine kinase
MPLELRVDGVPRLREAVEVAAYYMVCECLANAARHARAGSALVDVRLAGGLLVAEVTDDGIGGADPSRGSGLRGLADRVDALDGRLTVSAPPGGGTRVRAEIPCGPAVGAAPPGQKPATAPAGPPPSAPSAPLRRSMA